MNLAKEMHLTFEISFSRFDVIFFTFHKLLRYWIDGFPSPKEGVLRIFNALKNSSPSAGFEPANLESNDKHANHYITEDD
jgi:hypothetical protein